MRRVFLGVLAGLLLVPGAAAGEVAIERVEVPDRTVAEHPFEVAVWLRNGDAARTVHLFAALYRPDAGAAPCGPATDARFRGWTPLVQASIAMAAGERARFPAEGGSWLHRYRAEGLEPGPRVEEFCVFAAEDQDTRAIDYEDHKSVPLSVRGRNAPPVASFTWSPASPRALEEARFTASGRDVEGDPLAYRWDFGRHTPAGRANATGPTATHAFFPAGVHTVTLRVTDGLDEGIVVHRVTVLAEDAPRPETRAAPGRGVPWGPLALAALLVAPLLRRSG